ncbi:MAG: nicotinate-nucleotide diphosphorylase (carboxylating) [Balneola sp.]|nr:nicotinate-nucleotide diphosphorylase (carboxylating) [Balneola sp.]|tara:strand:+ start:2700 stop:3530 length:831 start_codon:yes stop_codon:yes gene_type:complete
MNPITLKHIIKQALAEDLGMGDWSSQWLFDSTTQKSGRFVAKQSGIFSGQKILEQIYTALGGGVEVFWSIEDGQAFEEGSVLTKVNGPVSTLLSGERVILNLLQHLTGIASSTQDLILRLDDPNIKVVDTRKTLPGLRMIQKYAVRCGGGFNHRFRLDDGVIIKDNHIAAAGGIAKAVEMVRKQQGHMIKIEIEVETLNQVQQAVDAEVDVIMLDNQTPDQVKELRKHIPKSIIVELSGGINPNNIAGYKNCGADVISVGWITHSVEACDISFYID